MKIKTLKPSILNLMTLTEIFEQASRDHATKKIAGKGHLSYIYKGIKISKDLKSELIQIFDPIKGGDYHVEVVEDNYQLFYKWGWRKTVHHITSLKYQQAVDRLNEKIIRERNENKSQKAINQYKESKTNILKKYYKLNSKSNKL